MGIREEVMAEMTKVAADAIAQGRDGYKAVVETFPGVPIEVATMAWMEAQDAETERWWRSVERTIDGDLIKQAAIKAVR